LALKLNAWCDGAEDQNLNEGYISEAVIGHHQFVIQGDTKKTGTFENPNKN